MRSSPIQQAVALFLTICLVTMPIAPTVQAAIISTDTAIELTDHSQQIDRVNEILARESVRNVMISLGVDPADASARVQSLTPDELQTLEEGLAKLPAGGVGVIEVVGIVAIVLIVLELLNVTNFFSEF